MSGFMRRMMAIVANQYTALSLSFMVLITAGAAIWIMTTSTARMVPEFEAGSMESVPLSVPISTPLYAAPVVMTAFVVGPAVEEVVIDVEEVLPTTPPVAEAEAVPAVVPDPVIAAEPADQLPVADEPAPIVAPEPEPAPSTKVEPEPIPESPPAPAFSIRSVDVMKMTQDAVCGPPAASLINEAVEHISALGATHIAISTPYDDPACGSSLNLTKTWVNAARANGLNIWFRQKPLAFEGFYGYSKNLDPAYHLEVMADYIEANPYLFKAGDIFTPAPEPQNAGIFGLNCSSNCLFADAAVFNAWLRESMQAARDVFGLIGVSGITVGRFGFDGFIAWGDRNPDWEGIIEAATIAAENNTITVDHYFPADAEPDAEFAKIRQHFGSKVNVCLGEWGAIHGESAERVREVLAAARGNGITCINWWHAGPGGVGESLMQENGAGHMVTNTLYETLKKIYGGN